MLRRTFFKRLLAGLGVAAGAVPAPVVTAARVAEVTPVGMSDSADWIARLLQQQPGGDGRLFLQLLRDQNPAMLALVQKRLTDIALTARRKEDDDGAA